MAHNKVVKCICHDRSFEEIKAYADVHNLTTVHELREHDTCCNGCGLCKPYIDVMLCTGQTEFTPGEPYRKNRSN